MTQVFYRRYRPQKFSEFIGQEFVVRTLTNAISLGILSHAYLFYGPRGSGKTTLARIFAKSLNCENRRQGEFEPCDECTSCREIREGRSMDLIEIDAASHRGIDEVRELKESTKFVPTRSKYKIYIIDEAHQITKDAANALLKIIEEPPDFIIFILATTEIQKMIPTILSRCQRFNFRKFTSLEISKKLEQIVGYEKIKIQNQALQLIAQNSDGSMRDAESILNQLFILFGDKEITVESVREILGVVERKTLSQFTDLLLQKKEAEAMAFLNDLIERGQDLNEFVKAETKYLREILLLKIINPKNFSKELSKDELEKMISQSQGFSIEELKKILSLFLDTQNKMKFSALYQLPLELAIIEACSLKRDSSS